jgi:HTH-type transcriptional regulator, glycine betaine synthesis regulator
MDNKLQSAQDKFMHGIGHLCDSFGLNKFLAQLYSVLYFNEKPMSLDEIAERLRASKSNVSINIRELEKWGAVKSVWVKGSRKDHYEANLDMKSVVLNKVKSGVKRRLVEVSNMIDEFKESIQSQPGDSTEEEKRVARICAERLDKIEELKSMALNISKLTENLL